MKRTFAIALLLTALASTTIAQQPDAEYQLLRHRYTVNNDGTTDYNFRKEITLIRNRAITAYADKGETFIIYDPRFETLTINESYTIRPDGSRVATPENAFVEQLPSQCADCGRFNDIRELAIIHTALEYNCTIVLDYTIHRSADLVNERLVLAQDCPVKRYEVEINVPEKYELVANLKRSPYFNATFTEKGDAHSYSLTGLNLPQNFRAAYLPADDELYPTLTFYNGTPQFRPEFDNEGLPESMLTVVNLMQDKPFHTVRSLRNFVADNIHLNNLPPALLGYTHATALQTWESGCGTPTDRAVLLAAMLRTAGFEATVYGDNYDRVAVTIDTLQYDATPDSKTHRMPIIGEAHEAVNTKDQSRSITPTFDTLEGGYYRWMVPIEKGCTHMKLDQLAPSRKAPVKVDLCNEHYKYTVDLPKGLKMISPAVEIEEKCDSLGSVSVKIKQSGRKLTVERSLTLEREVVYGDDYAALRRLLTAWQSHNAVLLKKK